MNPPVLTTKLFIPPTPAEMVSRPHLLELLDSGVQRQLTIISAPAGFGKTTLLSEWAHPAREGSLSCSPIAWVSLDKEDSDTTRFWTYITAALESVWTDASKVLLGKLHSTHPPTTETFVTLLINGLVTAIQEIPQSSRYALVLDDYHLIESQAVHDGLGFLIEHMPPQMHLIVTGRADPPLALSRMRGQGQLNELRASDLRFTLEEIEVFLNDIIGIEVSQEDMAALERSTEGWIAGLQMAALSLQGQNREQMDLFFSGFTGNHRHVQDYLVDEVLDRQPADIQSFLLNTAILERLCAQLCAEVTNRNDGQQVLEQIEASNLFLIPLDDERMWYRYHHLFGELLRNRLKKADPNRIPILHLRASGWYEQNGFVAEAVRHALEANDVERAAHLVAGNALAMMGYGQLGVVMGWLETIAEEMAQARPWLYVTKAWAMVYTGRLKVIEELLQDAEKGLGDQEVADKKHITGHIAVIRGYATSLQGDKPRAAELARQALELLPEDDVMARSFAAALLAVTLRWKGDLTAALKTYKQVAAISHTTGDCHVAVGSLCDLAILYQTLGRLNEAAATCQRAIELADKCSRQSGRQIPIAGYAYSCMSRLLLEWNDIEGAMRYAKRSIELCKDWGWLEVEIAAYRSLAHALSAAGEGTKAIGIIKKMKQMTSDSSPWLHNRLLCFEARMKLTQGDVEAASRWARESGLCPQDNPGFQEVGLYILLADVLATEGRLGEALSLLDRLLTICESAQALLYMLEILILQAQILQAQTKPSEARSKLRRAITIAEPEGFTRVFVQRGSLMSDLLRQFVATEGNAGYAAELLASFDLKGSRGGDYTPRSLVFKETRLQTVPAVNQKALIEPLSPRELECLELLALGLSNKEIAQALFIAVGTVKNHLKNIYGKLSVHSRTQAVARARELGLLYDR